ncbi:MAG: Chemoreceptor glutamine deamidase CheD [Turneriella sp.]|nr:Chemoreceptor glutamine deamidase CheD [Turneriella sp.]
MRLEQIQKADSTPPIFEVYLQPGEYYWGNETHRIKTLLGSCVAICVWHPLRKIGGMSHCLLPSRSVDGLWNGVSKEIPQEEWSGRYVDETFALFFSLMRSHKTLPQDYQVKVFGGGNMFELQDKNSVTVGERNIEMVKRILAQEKIPILSEHMGGKGHRSVIFELWNGGVWMRHTELP